MLLKSERVYWYSDTERLAKMLANKNLQEIQEIFDANDLMYIPHNQVIPSSIISRLSLFLVWPTLVILSGIKWIFTGNRFLDVWAKKYKIVEYMYQIVK